MTDLHWSFQVDPSDTDVAELRGELAAHNIQASHIAQSTDMAVFLHDAAGKLVGSVTGNLLSFIKSSAIRSRIASADIRTACRNSS